MLVFIGLIVGIFHIFPHLKITPSLIYYVFLPIIILEGAVNIKLEHLKTNVLPIGVLSIIGTIISAIFIGIVLHFAMNFPIKQSLIFGAIITPTDPLSVIALLKAQNGINENNNEGINGGIKTILEGESLFNDGIALVLFEVFLSMHSFTSGFMPAHPSSNPLLIIGASALKFLYEFIGGSILGALLGYGVSLILSITYDYLTEIMISLLLAYVSLIIAYYLDVSFIMAIIFGGIVLSNYGFKNKVTSQTAEVFPVVIQYLTFIINSLLFLIIGIEINLFKIINIWFISIFIIFLVLFSRFMAIYLLSPLINFIETKFKIFSKSTNLSKTYKNFLVFGGLRGALPIAMALSLPLNFFMRSQIITYVFITVLFSLTVQAIIFDIFSKKKLI